MFNKASFINDVMKAHKLMCGIVHHTPLTPFKFNNKRVLLKREDLQPIKSFKIRGAFNKMMANTNNNFVCASAGNHAQGFAFTCNKLGIHGDVFVPHNTPLEKIKQIKHFGNKFINLHMCGNNFMETLDHAITYCRKDMTFVHPFDDYQVIVGQGTIGRELELDGINNESTVIIPIGGGGLISGVGMYLKNLYPGIKIIGVQPEQCPSMKMALEKNYLVKISTENNFVGGATVGQVGKIPFEICKSVVDDIITVPDGVLCRAMISLYFDEGKIVEPAGALSVAALNFLDNKYNNIVCIISGGNIDLGRFDEIKHKALVYENKIHYFIVNLAPNQTTTELKTFINKSLDLCDYITRWEYMKKTSDVSVLIGIEVAKSENIYNIIEKLQYNYKFQKVDSNNILFD